MNQSQVNGVVTPHLETFGVLTRDAEGRLRVDGDLLFDDPGAAGNVVPPLTCSIHPHQHHRGQRGDGGDARDKRQLALCLSRKSEADCALPPDAYA